MERKGISVVIPNYNGAALFRETLPSVFNALQSTGLSFEIIVCDDCSTDNSISVLENEFREIKIIRNEKNLGFSPTINKGIFASIFDHVLLLNSDVKLSENYFKPLLKYFEMPDTFGVMGRIIGWNDEKIQDAAKYPSFHGVKIKTTGNYYMQEPDKNDRLLSMYLSGANAFVDRKKLVQLGGFDEIYAPFYVEDYDLSLRAWRIGWKCYYDHFAVCRHQVSVSIKNKSRKNNINTIYYRNKMFLHAIHLKGSDLFLWYLQFIPETLFKILTGKTYMFSSVKLFLKQRRKIGQSRNHLNSLSVQLLSVKEVAEKIKSSIPKKAIIRF